MATAEMLMTAKEFSQRPDPGYPEELVHGRIVGMAPPNRRHGQVCSKVDRILGNYVEEHDLGHVLSNDSGVITERDPDTVRGADVCFYRYATLPKGPLPSSYGPEVPDLIVEVRSPGDRWAEILVKVAEYLAAGVKVVCLLDPDAQVAQIIEPDGPLRVLSAQDELTFPAVLGDFRVRVGRFFE